MTDLSEAQRRAAAIRRCDRVLSYGRPPSMREGLTALLEGGCDLGAVPDQYGDGIVRELEERVAGLPGRPAERCRPSAGRADAHQPVPRVGEYRPAGRGEGGGPGVRVRAGLDGR